MIPSGLFVYCRYITGEPERAPRSSCAVGMAGSITHTKCPFYNKKEIQVAIL